MAQDRFIRCDGTILDRIGHRIKVRKRLKEKEARLKQGKRITTQNTTRGTKRARRSRRRRKQAKTSEGPFQAVPPDRKIITSSEKNSRIASHNPREQGQQIEKGLVAEIEIVEIEGDNGKLVSFEQVERVEHEICR